MKKETLVAEIKVASFKSMSKPQRKRFIAWLRENADWFESTKWNIADDFTAKLSPLKKQSPITNATGR